MMDRQEDLAEVVIAGKPRTHRGPSGWHAVRPWLFCAVFLLIANIALASYVEKAFRPWSFRLNRDRTQWDPLAVKTEIMRIQRFSGKRILLLGDSAVYAASIPEPLTLGGQIRSLLRKRYPGVDFEVFNLAMPASRAGDVYAVLKQAAALKPVLVILNTNYEQFSRAQIQLPFRYKYLKRALINEPDVEPLKRDEFPANSLEVVVSEKLMVLFPLYRYRDLLNGLFFGGHPVERLRGVPAIPMRRYQEPKVTEKADLPWFKRNLDLKRVTGSAYINEPFDAYPNPNITFSHKIASFLDREHIPAIVFQTPQNQTFLAPLIQNKQYENNVKRIDSIFRNHSFQYQNYQAALDHHLFIDNDHLTAQGCRVLAERLLEDNKIIFEKVMTSGF